MKACSTGILAGEDIAFLSSGNTSRSNKWLLFESRERCGEWNANASGMGKRHSGQWCLAAVASLKDMSFEVNIKSLGVCAGFKFQALCLWREKGNSSSQETWSLMEVLCLQWKCCFWGWLLRNPLCCETCSISPFLQVSAERKLRGLMIFFIGSSLCVPWAPRIAK